MSVATIEGIFHKSQFNANYHRKLIEKLISVYEKVDAETFFKKFILCLQVVLIHGEKHAAVERVVDFAVKFSSSLNKAYQEENKDDCASDGDHEDEELCPFIISLFNFLLKNHQCNSQSIRFRVCQLINKILQSLGDDASIDDELCSQISECMMERLQDKSPAVRAQAVSALQRLQDPTNPNCPVIKAFIFHMHNDPSPDVRRSVLKCIGRSNLTLHHVRERTYDVNENVRKQAYLAVSRINIRSFTIHLRELVLRDGLRDRSDLVRNCVEKTLLPAWLENLDSNYLQLLHALDVENSRETSELALNAFFQYKSKNEMINVLSLEKHLVPLERLTSEVSFFWKCLAQFLHKNDEVEDLEQIIPELTPFCEYIRKYMEKLKPVANVEYDEIQHEFVLLQLLELATVFDLSDEVGRSNLKHLLLDLLTNVHVKMKLVPVIVQLLVDVIPDVNSRLQTLAEVISEIHEPLSEVVTQITQEERQAREFKKAQLRAQKLELQEDLDLAISSKDFVHAQEVNSQLNGVEVEILKLSNEPDFVTQEVRETRNDSITLMKCLTIVFEMMQSPSIKCLTPHLRSLMQNFVMNNLKIDDVAVNVKALETMAVFCLLDKELAIQNILMFYYYLGQGVKEACVVSLKAIFDMLLLYGLSALSVDEEYNEDAKKKKESSLDESGLFNDTMEANDHDTLSETLHETNINNLSFLSILASLLDESEGQIRSVTVEGLCKLYLAKKISSPVILSRMILLWFNPLTDDDTYIRQVLSEFFTMYATCSSNSYEVLEQAFLPTISTVIEAPHASPLINIDIKEVGKFILGLTKPGLNAHASQVNVHNNLAVAVCNEILQDPDTIHIKEWLKLLCCVELVIDDTQRQVLNSLVRKMCKANLDKAFGRYIHKFQQMLDSGSNVPEILLEDRFVSSDGTLTSDKGSLVGRPLVENGDLQPEKTTFLSARDHNDIEDDVFDSSGSKAALDGSILSISNTARKPRLSQDSQNSEESTSPTPFTALGGGIVIPETSGSEISSSEESSIKMPETCFVPISEQEGSPYKKIRMTRKRK